MQLTPTITFRGMEPSAALEADIRTRIAKLETYYHPIMGCRVIVEPGQRHHAAGNRYHVRIDLTVPTEEIVVAHDASLHGSAQDTDARKATKRGETDPERKHARVAVREAFDIARRRLQDFARRQRGTVKIAARQPRGRIARLSPIDEYGYIEAEDGHDVYFQKSSVLHDMFDRLKVGSRVTFVEEPGEKGPQASTVKLTHARRVRRPAAAESRSGIMQIKQVMTSDVATCQPDANLAVVAKLMWDRDCGFVPVIDATEKLVGVITDRDICIASATRRKAPEQITAARAMRGQPIHTCAPDDTIETALATMKEFKVRRLPVVAADGALTGIVSMNDVVLASRQKEGPAAAEIVSTLAAICAHRPAEIAAA